mmetsp:Transcript_48991/g.113540  ORF Transcript_48991/g.113540 Transcript_48991/m.113540 type:complete len:114 (-) Transcript_48991:83-424(-)
MLALSSSHVLGVLQRLSAETLHNHRTALVKLKVREMEASRQEDKEEILCLVGDTDSFDRNLQKILFEELFPSWEGLDARDQMLRTAHVIRWQLVCQKHGSYLSFHKEFPLGTC